MREDGCRLAGSIPHVKGTVRVLCLNSIYSPELSLPLMSGCWLPPVSPSSDQSSSSLLAQYEWRLGSLCPPTGFYLLGVVAVTNAQSTPDRMKMKTGVLILM